MSNCSNEKICPGGNCVGCNNGQTWCDDPRCHPYCPGEACFMHEEHDPVANIVITVIFFCLAALLVVLWLYLGPSYIEIYYIEKRTAKR